MKVIYKQELRLGCGEQTLRIKGLAEVLKLDMQGDVPCVWYLCDPDETAQDVVFTTLGTGDTSADNWFEDNEYIGSYQLIEVVVFVGHVFMRLE
jgi:hypothetical protein